MAARSAVGICQVCGAEYRSYPSQLRSGRSKFCSRACLAQSKADRAREGFSDRFWGRVDKNGPTPAHRPGLGACWLWIGARTVHGYGLVGTGSVKDGTNRMEVASRVAYRLDGGVLTGDQKVCHHCDNPPCVRPSHLFGGTTQDNQDDMVSKGRSNRGNRHPRVKLTLEQVSAIRETAASGVSHRELVARFPVSRSQIGRIVRGESWIAPPLKRAGAVELPGLED